MRRAAIIVSILVIASLGRAQTWQQVFKIPQSTMSCAYFFNAQEGMIGTGNYFGGAIAKIYFTTDGGTTWTRAALPSNAIVGQVNEIFFHGPNSGWATITEATPTGWSGVYHSTDRGRSWRLIHQAGFPVGIRETSRGVYYTDRDINPGVNFSSDQGKTWRGILGLSSCLDIDFYDDDNGFVTSQAYGSPPAHAATTDGGVTWRLVETDAECWSIAADRHSKSFILASEQTNGGTGSSTSLLTATSTAAAESKTYFGIAFALTGGVRVYDGCATVAYAQVRRAAGALTPGFLRSTNDGATWSSIDGPCNRADTRFGVTGRGAVIFAGDSIGGVWKTSEAANVSPSVLSALQVTSTASAAKAYICDSTTTGIRLSYAGCDSVRITNAWVENDTANEVSLLQIPGSSLRGSTRDSIVLRFTPHTTRTWTARIHITLVQPDGYEEDTTLSLLMLGLRPTSGSLRFAGTAPSSPIDFDSAALCSTISKAVTLQSTSCYDLHVTGVRVTPPFRLRSSFSPFTLTSDAERSFLIEYSPALPAVETGSMIVTHDQGVDTLLLTGRGISPRTKLSFPSVSIQAAACDSGSVVLPIRNITCSPISHIVLSGLTHLNADASDDSIGVDHTLPITIRLVPASSGSGADTLHVRFDQLGTTYDTVIVIRWTAIEGKPAFALSENAMDYGDLSPCSTGSSDTLIVYNTGCAELTLASSIDDASQGFKITRTASRISQQKMDTIIVRYTPIAPGSTGSTRLRLSTNAGDITILLTGKALAGNGDLTFGIDSVSPILTCESTPFTISIRNASCDSVYLLGENLLNANSLDFAFTSVIQPLSRDASIDIPLTFQPEAAGLRSNSIVLHFLRADGSPFDTSFTITATAFQPPPVDVYLEPIAITSNAGQVVTFPVFVEGNTAFPVRTLQLTLAMKTDLLTPIGLVGGEGQLGDASISRIDVKNDSATIYVSIPAERSLSSGELVRMRCRTFVADTLQTPIVIERASFDNGASQARCLPASLLDSTAHFTLDPLCGDVTISRSLAAGRIIIDRIAPNPTRSEVVLHLRSTMSHRVDAVLEVLNTTGECVQTEQVQVAPGVSEVSVALQGSEGVRYVRIRTPSGEINPTESRPVILQK